MHAILHSLSVDRLIEKYSNNCEEHQGTFHFHTDENETFNKKFDRRLIKKKKIY